MLANAREAVRTLNPGYFALVMATGILSIAMFHQHAYALSVALFWLCGIAFIMLLAANTLRITAFRREFAHDLSDPARAFGVFTFVAAADVTGSRFALDKHFTLSYSLLASAWVAWLLLSYIVPWFAIVQTRARPAIQRANGTWFTGVVASQSVAVLAATLEPALGSGRRELALLAVFCWSVGVFLYGAVGIFVAARIVYYPFRPQDCTPAYWVAMGAAAITVLAGARIVEMASAPMVVATRGLIAGVSVVFWAFGTWLLMPLVGAGIWRHVIHRVPLRYEASLWSIVFPLGMYGVGSDYLGQADRLPIVKCVGEIESWGALTVWTVTFVAMLYHLAVTLVFRRRRRQTGHQNMAGFGTAAIPFGHAATVQWEEGSSAESRD